MPQRSLLYATLFLALSAASLPALGQCTDADSDGYYYETGCGTLEDCNDAAPGTYPGVIETCEGYDNDCDGTIDNDPSCDRSCDYPERVGDEVQLTSPPDARTWPSLVWAGTEFGVAWMGPGDPDVYFARLDASGTPIGGAVTIPHGSRAEVPSLSWTGSEYGLAFLTIEVGGYFINVTRLNAIGGILGNSVASSRNDRAKIEPVVTWSGDEYGVVWGDRRPSPTVTEIFFGHTDSAGVKIGDDVPISLPDGAKSYKATLRWTGSEYGTAWVDYRNEHVDIYFARISPAGVKIGDDVLISSSLADSSGPSLTWNGLEYGLAWNEAEDEGKVLFARLDASGSVIDGPMQVTNNVAASYSPSLVWNGEEYGFVWIDEQEGSPNIYFARMDAWGVRLSDDVRITTPAASGPAKVRLVWTGADYGVAWQDYRHGDAQIYFAKIGCDCFDEDDDGFSVCAGDCDDTRDFVNPGGTETCNDIDDDCDILVDEDELGEDTDSDDVHNLCDNCREVANPSQLDTDTDGVGNSCDNCVFEPNPIQSDQDADNRGDLCDNCILDYNPAQDDWEPDGVGDACDNCIFLYNPTQTDVDSDYEGDLCDLNDGMIYVAFYERDYVEWQEEEGFDAWNCYKGDLAVLRDSCATTGCVYTQLPGSGNDLAARVCGVTDAWMDDFTSPPTGEAAFFLTTGMAGTVENSLGQDSSDTARLNANPCP